MKNSTEFVGMTVVKRLRVSLANDPTLLRRFFAVVWGLVYARAGLLGITGPFGAALVAGAGYDDTFYACFGAIAGYLLVAQPSANVGFVLLCANMAMGELSRYSGLTVSFKVPRSGLFLGLPMFSLGLFLREHRETLLSRLGMGLLPVVPVFGFLLTIVEWKCFGGHSLYLGHFFVLAGLLLLTFRYPGVPRSLEKAAVLCGPVSTVVYLVHLTLCDVYLGFFQWRLEGLLGSAEAWIRPLLVLGASIMAAWCWLMLVRLCKRFRK